MGCTIWVDATAGVAGDMLAAAFVDAGVPLQRLQSAVDAVVPGVQLTVQAVERAGLAATKLGVVAADAQPHRHLADIERLLRDARLEPATTEAAIGVFRRLAEVEAAAHGVSPTEVHFHEVGAIDSIADIVATCEALRLLDCDTLLFSRLELGSGTVRAAHGVLSVPTPAALRLSEGLVVSGEGPGECATPTGIALLTSLGAQHLQLPQMRIRTTGFGAGTRERQDRANVVRVVIGETADSRVLTEANIDDMDPRLWPRVLELLMAAGADDAWLTPIVMKKGRPALTLSVLCSAAGLEALQSLVFEHTTTIGMRTFEVEKIALDRASVELHLEGHRIRVKLAGRHGRVLNVSFEFEDIAAAARELGCAERDVLERAGSQAVSAGYVIGSELPID